jgi:hypothetical protein
MPRVAVRQGRPRRDLPFHKRLEDLIGDSYPVLSEAAAMLHRIDTGGEGLLDGRQSDPSRDCA